MRSTFIAVSLLALLSVCEQTASAQRRFDVASVRLSGPQSVRGSGGGPGTRDPGLFRFGLATLKELVVRAYGVEYFQVEGKLPIDRDRYDVVARVPPNTTKVQFRLMLQNLLAERFRVSLHKESRDLAAYQLIVAKSGLKVKESGAAQVTSTVDDGFPALPEGQPGMVVRHTMSNGRPVVRLRARQMPIREVARQLHGFLGAPVVDATGLTGVYDFMLEYSEEVAALPGEGLSDPAGLPSVFAAVQRQLGLQLVSKRLPFDMFIIDAFDRVPTEN